MPDPVQCPICGWTGQPGDLVTAGGTRACPACGEDLD